MSVTGSVEVSVGGAVEGTEPVYMGSRFFAWVAARYGHNITALSLCKTVQVRSTDKLMSADGRVTVAT